MEELNEITVAELIEILNKLDQSMPVCYRDYPYCNLLTPSRVKVEKLPMYDGNGSIDDEKNGRFLINYLVISV